MCLFVYTRRVAMNENFRFVFYYYYVNDACTYSAASIIRLHKCGKRDFRDRPVSARGVPCEYEFVGFDRMSFKGNIIRRRLQRHAVNVIVGRFGVWRKLNACSAVYYVLLLEQTFFSTLGTFFKRHHCKF